MTFPRALAIGRRVLKMTLTGYEGEVSLLQLIGSVQAFFAFVLDEGLTLGTSAFIIPVRWSSLSSFKKEMTQHFIKIY